MPLISSTTSVRPLILMMISARSHVPVILAQIGSMRDIVGMPECAGVAPWCAMTKYVPQTALCLVGFIPTRFPPIGKRGFYTPNLLI
jgi:hypothetical protein